MSNDLISRSAVIDVIKRHECDTSRIAEGVMELPVAYDVDKVVEEMQDLLWDCYTDSGVGIDRKTGFEAYKKEMERILRH